MGFSNSDGRTGCYSRRGRARIEGLPRGGKENPATTRGVTGRNASSHKNGGGGEGGSKGLHNVCVTRRRPKRNRNRNGGHGSNRIWSLRTPSLSYPRSRYKHVYTARMYNLCIPLTSFSVPFRPLSSRSAPSPAAKARIKFRTHGRAAADTRTRGRTYSARRPFSFRFTDRRHAYGKSPGTRRLYTYIGGTARNLRLNNSV